MHLIEIFAPGHDKSEFANTVFGDRLACIAKNQMSCMISDKKHYQFTEWRTADNGWLAVVLTRCNLDASVQLSHVYLIDNIRDMDLVGQYEQKLHDNGFSDACVDAIFDDFVPLVCGIDVPGVWVIDYIDPETGSYESPVDPPKFDPEWN